ncbi:O-antigen ligase family protein [Acetivibrio cellulolyticus]|uniref:O-antigen ligase family protein n=1 Tax=Acetivibrio cellulolyticus TaxID=35830 RepID=UPI0001E2D197|nr:O-antigen ligase family protein [Acetivibrio cellulolyticus]
MIYNSFILKPIFYIIRIIEASYPGSFTGKFFAWVLRVANRVNEAYENSLIHRVIDKVVVMLIVLFTNSSIFGFFARSGRVGKWWENSLIFRFANFLFTAPSNMFKNLYRSNEAVFKESIFLRLLSLLLHRFEIIIGMVLFVTLIAPHEMWHNIYSAILAIALLVLLFICTVIKRNSYFNLKAFDFSLVLFMLIVALSWITSINRGLSFNFLLINMTCFLFVILIVSSIKNEKSLGAFVEIILAGITVISLYGLWQFASDSVRFDPSLTNVKLNEGMPGRVYATVFNPNNFAEILIMMLPFYVAVILNAKTFVKKAIFSLMGLSALAVLFCTGARSAWIAFAVSALVFTFFKNKRLLPLMMVVGIIAVPFLPQHVYRRIQTLFNLSKDTSAQYRVKIIQTSWPMLKDYVLTGVGLGTDVFMDIVGKYKLYTSKVPVHTHVLYMQIWIEMGIMGILSFVWFLFRTVKSSVTSVLEKSNVYFTNVLIAGISSLLGILTMAAVEYIWYYPRVMLFFWVDVAIVLSVLSIIRIRKNKLTEN